MPEAPKRLRCGGCGGYAVELEYESEGEPGAGEHVTRIAAICLGCRNTTTILTVEPARLRLTPTPESYGQLTFDWSRSRR